VHFVYSVCACQAQNLEYGFAIELAAVAAHHKDILGFKVLGFERKEDSLNEVLQVVRLHHLGDLLPKTRSTWLLALVRLSRHYLNLGVCVYCMRFTLSC